MPPHRLLRAFSLVRSRALSAEQGIDQRLIDVLRGISGLGGLARARLRLRRRRLLLHQLREHFITRRFTTPALARCGGLDRSATRSHGGFLADKAVDEALALRRRSALALAPAAERLSDARIPFKLVAEAGDLEERIAAVAAAERVDDILRGESRNTADRYLLPASIAGFALLFAID